MKIRIKRQRPDGQPYWQEFLYQPVAHENVAQVLDTLNYRDDLYDIEGKKAPHIAWECSCQQKQCGACAMVICGNPSLACATFPEELPIKNDTLIVEPLSKFPVIEDLRVDRSILYENLKASELWLTDPARVDSDRYATNYDAAKCLKCGLCLEVCPNYLKGTTFFGPAMIPETYLSVMQGKKDGLHFHKNVAAGCSKSGACQKVCPMQMDTLGMFATLSGRHVLSKKIHKADAGKEAESPL